MRAWFALRGDPVWHAVRGADETMTAAMCGMKVLGFPSAIEGTEADPYPPTPCTTCRVEVAMEDAVEEPIDEAKARGFVPYRGEPD